MDLMSRRRSLMTAVIPKDLFHLEQFTEEASRTQGVDIIAPVVTGYTFLCWLGVSCDDYNGFAYMEFPGEQATKIFYNTLPTSATGFHNTYSALYIKTRFKHLARVEHCADTETAQGQLDIDLPDITGFTFIGSLAESTTGGYGATYVASYAADNSYAVTFNAASASGRKRHVYALYLDSNYSDLVKIIPYEIPFPNIYTAEVTASDVSGYRFMFWTDAATVGFLGRPGIRGRTLTTCTGYSYNSRSNGRFKARAFYFKTK